MGEHEAKATPFSCYACTLHPDASSHRFNQLFTDIESQSRAWSRCDQVSPEPNEFLKEQCGLNGWNTWPEIFDAQTDHAGRASAVVLTEGRPDDHGRLPGGILERIGEQVAQHLTGIVRIAPHSECFWDIKVNGVRLTCMRVKVGQRILYYSGDRVRFTSRRSGSIGGLCSIQHVVHEPLEFFTATQGLSEKVRLGGGVKPLTMVIQEFEIAVQLGEGSA